MSKKINYKHLIKHETKIHIFKKFLLILFIFIGYFIFIAQKYGFQQGFLVTLLTWSFFVLCTPIADAGFLIDFPLRLITNLRMFVLEILVWIIAISINLYAFFFVPEVYDKTEILIFFKHILIKPFPFGAIILISMIGTFISIQFGDELLDRIKHKERTLYHKRHPYHKFIVILFLIFITIVLYNFLLNQIEIDLPSNF